ncbi:DUF5655 domain-containing protein [Microbacterium sp. 1.5R]|uniref:DUF5655 domain-containing protein n=1 Tax=Microbacterium sp. 1.5R TaxID=1916917 RepID=UPI0011A3D838|nr:DUF5655 domain-containing protein [Microbacterium sp. 1.5R]
MTPPHASGGAHPREAEALFPGPLGDVYSVFRTAVLALGDDIDEQFTKTQVAYRLSRQFAWLSPVSGRRALITVDLWEERESPMLTNVIRFRDDKVTHQIEVRTADEVKMFLELRWFPEAVSWGRKTRKS